MRIVPGFAVLLALCCGAALAEAPGGGLPTAAMLAERAGKRFPQPVRVGDLIGRDVLQPEEAQPVLGRVLAVVRRPDGGVDVVVLEGTTLGLGGRPVAVPIEAVALLGEHVALLDYTPAQLSGLPTASAGVSLPAAETIRVGLVKPFH